MSLRTNPAADELPALVLVTLDLSRVLLRCKGAEEVQTLHESNELLTKLNELEALKDDVEPNGRKTNWWRRQNEERCASALDAADWMRRAQKGRKLVLLEPEGTMKKQCNISVVADSMEARNKRRASMFGASRNDAFFAACVPFFRALLLHLPPDGDSYDPNSAYGDGPAAAELRDDAPDIAFVTNLGHIASKCRPGETKTLEVEKVRLVLAKLLARLASELGVPVEALARKVSVWISFCAHGGGHRVSIDGPTPPPAAPPGAVSTTDAPFRDLASTWAGPRDGEQSEEWSKPEPGMLHAAMLHHRVEPHEALMIGYDMVDQEAAHRAGVDYVNQQHVIGFFDKETIKDRLISAGVQASAKAPQSFATHKSGGASSKAVLRSPQRPSAVQRES